MASCYKQGYNPISQFCDQRSNKYRRDCSIPSASSQRRITISVCGKCKSIDLLRWFGRRTLQVLYWISFRLARLVNSRFWGNTCATIVNIAPVVDLRNDRFIVRYVDFIPSRNIVVGISSAGLSEYRESTLILEWFYGHKILYCCLICSFKINGMNEY